MKIQKNILGGQDFFFGGGGGSVGWGRVGGRVGEVRMDVNEELKFL